MKTPHHIELYAIILLVTLISMFTGKRCMAMASDLEPEARCETPAPDSAALKALSAKLETYVNAIEGLSIDEQSEECDFLISSCNEEATRQFVATWLYRHYYSSRIMGVEGVAVHIVDEWFTTGKARPASDIELMNARIFADFNRASLIGKRAPGITLKTRSGEDVEVFGGNDYEEDGGHREARNTVLYFYDTGCANCLIQSIMLRNILKDTELDINLIAVYTGCDSLAWDGYIEERLSPMPGNVEVLHLWDPELDSDFQRKYGILQTPGMFLIDRDLTIVGRKLDAAALALMLKDISEEENYSYGNEESGKLFDKLFSTFDGEPGLKDINSITDLLASKTAGMPAFRTTMGDLLYYFSEQLTGRYKEGSAYLIENYILPNKDIWSSEHDSLCVIAYAESYLEIVNKAMPGSRIHDIKVNGILVRGGVPSQYLVDEDIPQAAASRPAISAKEKCWRLDKVKKGTYIFIFNRMCYGCLLELGVVDRAMAANPRLNVLIVDTCDMDPDAGGEDARLFEAFDLSLFPYILKVGPKGRIAERYLEAGDIK